MKKYEAVIGLNYGDEGKGNTVAYLVSRAIKDGNQPLVVRHSGGAQAGHTVCTNEYGPVVFQHFGAGTILGAPTLLAREFILNPIKFFDEWKALSSLKMPATEIYVDARCKVSTPFDMLLNQESENKLGENRHGSVGLGINETMVSHSRGYGLVYEDLHNPLTCIAKIESYVRDYLPNRLKELGLPAAFISMEDMEDVVTLYMTDLADFTQSTISCIDTEVIAKNDHVIFEGSQGLRLSQDSEDFPHVTHAYTGLKNVNDLLTGLPDVKLDVYYITRTYLTRHGKGPLNNEIPNPGLIDNTNVTNQFQGYLRFSSDIDLGRIERDVKKDLIHVANIPHTVSSVITWCDESDKINADPVNAVIEKIATVVGTSEILTWWGPLVTDCQTKGK